MIAWSAVEIGDDHVAALRLLLKEGPEAWERLHKEKMATDEAAAGYMQMFYAAFTIAVRRKFGRAYTIHQIVQYVARLRIEFRENDDSDFSPRIAENAIRAGLGDQSLQKGDYPQAIEDVRGVQHLITAQTFVLFDVFLTEEESADGELVEEYVQEATELAQRWVREKQEAQLGERASGE
ncbi:hypothetical protein [Spirillospora sp. NPDC048819]|uniref:hypothetical protein n=1 Tax=Spirillospora sp. NPDC048819 TaxID=3155268 RepID=UPI0033D1A8A2